MDRIITHGNLGAPLSCRLASAHAGIDVDQRLHHGTWRDRREVAHRGLLRGGKLDDLRAQVRRANRTEVLLVRLGVARVLEQHVRVTSLDLVVKSFVRACETDDATIFVLYQFTQLDDPDSPQLLEAIANSLMCEFVSDEDEPSFDAAPFKHLLPGEEI